MRACSRNRSLPTTRTTIPRTPRWRRSAAASKRRGPRLPRFRDAAAVCGELPAQERCRDQAGGVLFVHELPQRPAGGELAGEDLVELQLADHVAGAVAGLLQIEVLFEPH